MKLFMGSYGSIMYVFLFILRVGSRPAEIAEVIGKMLEFCIEQEWSDTEDSDIETLSYKFTKQIVGSYVRTVRDAQLVHLLL